MNPENLELRYQYQTHLREAAGADEKTIDEVVRTIAEFEEHLDHRGFDRLQTRHSLSFKKHLMVRASKTDGKPLSSSTILHKLGHLREFLSWLKTRSGYRQLDSDVIDFLFPPRREEMAARTPPPRTGLPMERLIHVLKSMGADTFIERRDRAAIALIILTGVRDAALVSLRRKHIDLGSRRLNQDAKEVDTKFGKNLWTVFFPVPSPALEIVTLWVEELDAMGHSLEAPLFPREPSVFGSSVQVDYQFWMTAGPVRKILKGACTRANVTYFTPHSIRHTLSVYGNDVCRTQMERKAWSQNLGHRSLATTERSYGTLDHDTVAERLAQLANREPLDDILELLLGAEQGMQDAIRQLLLTVRARSD